MRKSAMTLAPATAGLALLASPAAAATGPFFSLHNTNFIVLLAFILFIAILVYFKVPGLIAGLLDKRSAGIKSELDEARALRDEAQSLLASYERKQKEVQAQADRIVESARADANAAADQAKDDLKVSIARRLKAAEEQIESAEKAAVKEVRDRAIVVAVAAARDVIAKQLTKEQANGLIDSSIDTVKARLN
ncbi:F0F1 ATP synthase subunit B [Pseudooceanicola sediminis]|uniref:ATP synthase subunit b n=1 Tax=Pseudooceanicola sediminis TaxID=2211117 RepID=A0A399IZR5_9RHOB|nr:F0F1 ATP synthase subunit B [Pseudooceanicola sediminis]KAA2313580.1 F0F1 ATP synthase subunit B [Puniceibacterium sp. HSS470]RII38575.1 F0F1 ATP synthase subunit B [Pseudooceanicola sediminis]|tara:strand:+ start:29124 stop:29699 length:576 start_codon:yes stop_codon:yes gene_type:complete